MGMDFAELVIASGCYATGGLFMKYSQGMTRPLPVLAFTLLFLAGASLQALGMRHADLAMAYILVLGLEAAIAGVFSIFILHESMSLARALAILIILAGVIMLGRTG
jgi:small multidrug resistance pump/quaternary ammonium compound-resistance protein SugE